MKYCSRLIQSIIRQLPQRFPTGFAFVLPILFTGLAGSPALAQTNQYRAFYYNFRGVLLDVENVTAAQMSARPNIQNISPDFDPPTINKATRPKNVCNTEGDAKTSDIKAVFVVYYAPYNMDPNDANWDQDRPHVQARPVKWEVFAGTTPRTFNCVRWKSDDVCQWPPNRCHCLTGTCCCY